MLLNQQISVVLANCHHNADGGFCLALGLTGSLHLQAVKYKYSNTNENPYSKSSVLSFTLFF